MLGHQLVSVRWIVTLEGPCGDCCVARTPVATKPSSWRRLAHLDVDVGTHLRSRPPGQLEGLAGKLQQGVTFFGVKDHLGGDSLRRPALAALAT